MSEYGLLMPFVGANDCTEYVKGFAGGRLWEILKNNDMKSIPYTFLTEDKIQIEMILKRYNCNYKIEDMEYGWSSITEVTILN